MKLILAVLMLVMVVRAQKNAKGTNSHRQRLPTHLFIGNQPERKSSLQRSHSETLRRFEPASENRRIPHSPPHKDFHVEDNLRMRIFADANRAKTAERVYVEKLTSKLMKCAFGPDKVSSAGGELILKALIRVIKEEKERNQTATPHGE